MCGSDVLMEQHVQIIYDESVVGLLSGNEITGLTFYVSSGFSDVGDAVITLGTTTAGNMNNDQWVSMSNTAVVYSGEMEQAYSQMTVTFTQPYTYSGGNLVVDINYDWACCTSASVAWLGVNTTDKVSAFDAYYEGAPQYTYTFLPKTTFTYSASSCLPANNFAVASLDTAAVSLSWISSPTAVSYNVIIGDSTYNTTETTLSVEGLTPGTLYSASLQAVCEDEALSQARSVSFRTPLAPVAVPYTTGFEPDDDNAMWQMLNGASAWGMSNAISSTGSQALYTSGDNGVSVGCQPSDGESYSFAVRSIYIESAGQYRLDYNWRPNTTVVYDYGRAYIAPVGASIEANVQPGGNSAGSYTPDGWVNAGRTPMTYAYNESGWLSDSCIFNINSSDTIINLVFLWYNGSNSDPNNGMAIDNVSLVKLPCATITGLTLDTTTANSATFHWDNTHYTYELEARLGDSVCASISVNGETTGTLTGLNIDNDYEVYLRGVCDGEEEGYTAWYGPVITHIGYCEPSPMRVDGQGIIEVTYGSRMSVNNTQHPTEAPFYGDYHTMVGVASPGDTLQVDITYSTTFGSVYTYGTIIWVDWNRDLEFSPFEVVYVGESDTTDPSVLHASFNIPTSAPTGLYRMRIAGASSGFDDYITSISAAAGADPCFSLDWAVAHDYSLRIAMPSSCPNADSAWVVETTATTATIAWTPVADSGATYTILLGSDTVATGLTDTEYTVDNLHGNTHYTFIVATDCVDSTFSFGTYVQALTDCGIVDELPWSEDFTSPDALRCWTMHDLDGVFTSNWYRNSLGEVRSNFCDNGPANAWLVTPALALPEGDGNVTLSWDAYGQTSVSTLSGEVHTAHMTVLLSATGNAAADFTDTLAFADLPLTQNHYSVALDAYAGDTVYIAFVHDSYFDQGPVVDNVSVAGGSVCAAPTTLHVTEATTNSISIAYNAMPETYYALVLSTGDAVVDSVGVSTGTYTFVNLTPATAYTVQVYTECGETLLPATPVTALTAMSVEELPYSTGFDSVTDGEWTTARGNYGWFVGSDTAASGTHSLYISADSGATRGYTVGAMPSNYAYKTFHVPAGQYSVSYDWLGEGSMRTAYMRVFLVPDGALLVDGLSVGIGETVTPAGWVDLSDGPLYGNTEWETVYRTFGIETEGDYSLVFYWVNGASGTATTAAAVDNVVFSPLTCQAPTDLAFSDITSDAVSLSWTSDADAWLVSIDGGAWQQVDTTYYTASGLSAATLHTFTIRSLCGAGDTSYALDGSFRTNCTDSHIPWIENFDTMTTTATASPMDCWNILGQGFVNAVPFTGHGQVLQFTPNMTSAPIIAVLPAFDTALTELQLSYRHAPEQIFSGTFSVGYITNVADSTTFNAIISYSGAELYSEEITFLADTLGFADAPADARIAFRYDYPGRPGLVDWFWLIDDVVVSLPDMTTYYSVTLSSEDPESGSVEPAGTSLVAEGTTFTATAIPAEGFIFSHWSAADGSDVSSSEVYTFTVSADVSLTAHFIPLDGIGDVDDSRVSVYPSLATDNITVTAEDVSRVQILDATGRVLTEGTASGRYDIRSLAAGSYLVRVVGTDGSVAIRRIVKM